MSELGTLLNCIRGEISHFKRLWRCGSGIFYEYWNGEMCLCCVTTCQHLSIENVAFANTFIFTLQVAISVRLGLLTSTANIIIICQTTLYRWIQRALPTKLLVTLSPHHIDATAPWTPSETTETSSATNKKTNIKHKKPLPFIKPQIAFRLFFVSFLRKIYSWLSQSKWIIVKCHVFISSIFILFSTFVCLIWLLMWIAENTIFFFVKGPRSMSSALSPRALRGLCRFFTSRAFILIFVPLKVI